MEILNYVGWANMALAAVGLIALALALYYSLKTQTDAFSVIDARFLSAAKVADQFAADLEMVRSRGMESHLKLTALSIQLDELKTKASTSNMKINKTVTIKHKYPPEEKTKRTSVKRRESK